MGGSGANASAPVADEEMQRFVPIEDLAEAVEYVQELVRPKPEATALTKFTGRAVKDRRGKFPASSSWRSGSSVARRDESPQC
jgi:hypothetical protein